MLKRNKKQPPPYFYPGYPAPFIGVEQLENLFKDDYVIRRKKKKPVNKKWDFLLVVWLVILILVFLPPILSIVK